MNEPLSQPLTREVLATLNYVRKFSGSTVLIKLGGAILTQPELVTKICEDLSVIRSVGLSIILVHGGGPLINAELKARGIEWEFIDGLRVTTPEMMDIIEMVLCGSVNRKIVRALNHSGVPAVGISGTDASTLLCDVAGPKLGKVGVIDEVNTSIIHSILNTQTQDGRGAIPVIAPVGAGKGGDTLNINADWAASRIVQSMGLKKVLYLTDQGGVLDKKGTLIPELDAAEIETLVETGVVQGGMLAKVRTILDALKNGVSEVHILNGARPHGLIEELFTDRGVGTVCRLSSFGRPTAATAGISKF